MSNSHPGASEEPVVPPQSVPSQPLPPPQMPPQAATPEQVQAEPGMRPQVQPAPWPSPAFMPARAPQMARPVRPPGPFRRGFGLGAGAGAGAGLSVLVVGTVLSLVTGLILAGVGLAVSANPSDPAVVTVWGSPSATKTLRAVDVKGPILTDVDGGALLSGGTYGYEVARMIDNLDADDAEALVLRISTPGGTITGSKAIADAIDRYKQRTNQLVFAHVQGLSASGGMYAMAGADDIRADHGSLLGSIGVIFGPFARYRDVTAIDGGLFGGGVTTSGGIEQFYLTQGRGKDVGNPYRDFTAEERAILTTGLENEYAAFVRHVSVNRGIPAEAVRDDLGAHLYDNATAEQKQLIDGTMGVDEAYRHFATAAGLDPASTRVVAATRPSALLSLLGSERRVPGQALPVEQVPGVRPITAAALCGPGTTVLVYSGDPQAECG
jgi:protease IV